MPITKVKYKVFIQPLDKHIYKSYVQRVLYPHVVMPQKYADRAAKRVAKQLWLPPHIKAMLKRVATNQGKSENELICDLIQDTFLKKGYYTPN